MHELTTKSEFLAAVREGQIVVITRKGNAQRYHQRCEHLQLDYFDEKVITHGGKSGKYFVVRDIAEARERWPGITDCYI